MARRKKPHAVYSEPFELPFRAGTATIVVYPYGQRFIAYMKAGHAEIPIEASAGSTTALEAAEVAKKFLRT